MPWRSFADGPTCSDPDSIAELWDTFPELKQRAQQKKKLVQLEKDSDGNEVAAPTMENMIANVSVLRPILQNMLQRRRVGSDPIEVIQSMVRKWYTLRRNDYQEYFAFQINAWISNDSWAIKKMISKMRTNVPKHEVMREAYPHLASTCCFLNFCWIPPKRVIEK